MTMLIEFTNNLFEYLKDEYGDRLMGYPFLANDENGSYIEGLIDKRAFQILFYKKLVTIKLEVSFGGANLLKELYEYLVNYLEIKAIINSNVLFDQNPNTGQMNIILNNDFFKNNNEKAYIKK